jgi:hypothetical protein
MTDEQDPCGDAAETDDAQARRERAATIREQLEQLKSDAAPEEEAARPEGPESPREFIERKMRERDEQTDEAAE